MIDYIQQLELRGIDWEYTHRDEKYIMVCCPFHYEEEASCSVGVHNGLWRCFGCKAQGNFVDMIAELDGIDKLTATSRVNNMLRPDLLISHLHKKYNREAYIKPTYMSWKKFLKVFKAAVDDEDALDYLVGERELSEETLQAYKVRYYRRKDSKYNERVIVPILDDQYRLNAYMGRLTFYSEYKPKTRKSGTPYFTLFGIPQLRMLEKQYGVSPGGKFPFVILVEGEFDCMYLWQFGLPALSAMGSMKLNKYRFGLLKKLTAKTVLAYDGDDAGFKGQNINKQLIKKVMPVEVVKLPWGRDPNSLSESEINFYFRKYLGNKSAE